MLNIFHNRNLLILPAFIAVSDQQSANAAQLNSPPNILIIVADDMGYAEMGCQGNKDIPTPNIDLLTRNGVRFTSGTNFYGIGFETNTTLNYALNLGLETFEVRWLGDRGWGTSETSHDVAGIPSGASLIREVLQELLK